MRYSDVLREWHDGPGLALDAISWEPPGGQAMYRNVPIVGIEFEGRSILILTVESNRWTAITVDESTLRHEDVSVYGLGSLWGAPTDFQFTAWLFDEERERVAAYRKALRDDGVLHKHLMVDSYGGVLESVRTGGYPPPDYGRKADWFPA